MHHVRIDKIGMVGEQDSGQPAHDAGALCLLGMRLDRLDKVRRCIDVNTGIFVSRTVNDCPANA